MNHVGVENTIRMTTMSEVEIEFKDGTKAQLHGHLWVCKEVPELEDALNNTFGSFDSCSTDAVDPTQQLAEQACEYWLAKITNYTMDPALKRVPGRVY